MINLSDYSCDKCAREFSRHCKHCYHTADKVPTRFKPKKKTGVKTPEFRRPTPPPPPTSGSNAVKPNPNYVPPASVKKSCPYELPCGWCIKWDKKCDKKIGDDNDNKLQRGLRANTGIFDDYGGSELDDIRSGKGLSRLEAILDPNKPLPSGIRRETRG